MFIKNTTPYVGKIKLTFEKDPYYTSPKSYSVLNNIHLDFGKFKLVSRMYPNKLENGYHKIDSEKIKIILEKTKGKIGIHEWWVCTSKNTGYNKTKYTKPDEKIWEIIDHNILEESFVTQNEKYIGDIQHAWWYVKNNLEVCEDYPHGVAREFGEFNQTTGYYGYTHRGGAIFKKGDRIFDENYTPIEADYPDWQWSGWKNKLEDLKNNSEDVIDPLTIKDVIPFNMRGKIPIDTWDESKEAARNLSKYL